MEKLEKIPVQHRGPIRHVLKQYQDKKRETKYVKRMQDTMDVLDSIGKKALCYEMHTPVIINKAKWLEVIEAIPDAYNYNKRSIYFNYHFGEAGTMVRDVKVGHRGRPIPTGPFISTADQTFKEDEVGEVIRAEFPEKSSYER